MKKSARNGIIAAAVVAVVGVAAAPFVVKTLKKEPAKPVDTSVISTLADDTWTYADPASIEEQTTADVIAEILETMDNQQNTASTQAQIPATQGQSQQQAQTQQQTPATTKTVATTKAPATTKATATTTKKSSGKTTKPAKTTTTKKSSGGQEVEADGPMTAVTGVDAMASGGVVSYMWNPEGNFYYVEDNPWQRNFGFNVIYDWSAAMLVMYYDTWRACFDYDNLEWMIQAWKGQYGFLFIGGEIGVYTREPGAAMITSTHYNCADDNHLINMEMSIYYDAHDGNGYKLMFTRSYYPHWWSTGFVDGHLADYKFNDRSCLIMMTRMTMYDEEMTTAFTNALEGCGFKRVGARAAVSTANSDSFTTVGNDVYFSWKNIDQGYDTRVSGK